jgi:hypothetical protein
MPVNSTPVSARLRTPVGAFNGSFRPASKKIPMPMSAESTAMRPTLLKVGKMSRQRMSSLIGGKVKPSIGASAFSS